MNRFVLVSVVMLYSAYLAAGQLCPSEICLCHEHGTVDCSEKRLDRIPTFRNTQEIIERLVLSRNDITSVPHYSFQNIRVKQIDVSGNPLVGISPRAFHGVEDDLELLDLHNSQLFVIHWAVFTKLVKLKTLNLSTNRLFTIQKELLQKLVELRHLDLSWNKLTRLNYFAFAQLEQLESLNLQGNALTSIDEATLVNQLHLTNLNLRSNRISHLWPNVFARLEGLVELDIGDNLLDSLDSDAFKALSTLQKLHLDQNNITEIAMGTFLGTYKLSTLSLAYNSIVNISYAVLESLPLVNLDLSSNKIEHFDGGDNCNRHYGSYIIQLKLNSNPLNCGCEMSWVSEVVKRKVEVIGSCETPSKYHKLPLAMVDFSPCQQNHECLKLKGKSIQSSSKINT